MINPDLIQISDEVTTALSQHKPVVALESTVIAHGLPGPENLRTALLLETTISDAGATPATIAIMQGKLCAGLSRDQIQQIAGVQNMKKVTTRDLPIAVARKWDGATTVASTIWIAHRSGIRVLATGGIGGVHRGPLADISADLPELARTPMVVVCSGAKIVLDLPATREWLETHGVTVVGYKCEEMPGFYSRKSGLPVDAVVDLPEEVAQIAKAQRNLGIERALLVCVPVPVETEVPSDLIEELLEEAVRDAEHEGIRGRDVTPFLLSRVAEQSKGSTLRANIALLENNARVAAEIALALGTW